MSLGVHALDVGIVVLALTAVTRGSCGIDTNHTAYQQTGPGADCRALIAANRRTGNRTNRRTDDSTAHCRLIGGLLAATATNLGQCKIAADKIIGPEHIH